MNILLTGASSGIGYQCAKKLVSEGHKLILPCRDNATSERTKKKLISDVGFREDNHLTPIFSDTDLSDLNQINDFTDELLKSKIKIDVLILNAGLQYVGDKNPRFSKQGFELTFAVNHLSHQLITQRLLPLLLSSSSPRVIVTSSEVHNPLSPGGRIGTPASLGKICELENQIKSNLIYGLSDFNADKAYKNSKLCNILFAKELYRRIAVIREDFAVIAWAPGLVIPKSSQGFFRYSRQYNQIGQRIFAFIARDLLKISETTEHAGHILQELATSSVYFRSGFSFYSNQLIRPGVLKFSASSVSEEAEKVDLARSLWIASEYILSKFNKK
ncbi:SDR family NAD(P)-dependent oxidoreductase [Prochlorococcus sp. MIT 1300]|uniref:SDR family NAD(P)-dependent oxidoreductase n=1 Tax=Prochlorococcus sp. MIT 1300 TaxID=3096218 RepID=UPI002A7559E7|nr:SDR family NAD(P)-dependent oxidoreductase [Prochlorococcus sp. MIT 1300]